MASSSASPSLSSVRFERKYCFKNFRTCCGVAFGGGGIGTAIMGLCCVDKAESKGVEPRGKVCAIQLKYVSKIRRLCSRYILEDCAKCG